MSVRSSVGGTDVRFGMVSAACTWTAVVCDWREGDVFEGWRMVF